MADLEYMKKGISAAHYCNSLLMEILCTADNCLYESDRNKVNAELKRIKQISETVSNILTEHAKLNNFTH